MTATWHQRQQQQQQQHEGSQHNWDVSFSDSIMEVPSGISVRL
jgi:hypothetical protein